MSMAAKNHTGRRLSRDCLVLLHEAKISRSLMMMRNYSAAPATRALMPTGGFLDGFAYSLHPYVGCACGDNDGCPFCYVRALPVARARAGPWGSWVIAKSNLLELLERELSALEKSGKLERAAIFMSSATDPYQGMERRMRLTRGAI